MSNVSWSPLSSESRFSEISSRAKRIIKLRNQRLTPTIWREMCCRTMRLRMPRLGLKIRRRREDQAASRVQNRSFMSFRILRAIATANLKSTSHSCKKYYCRPILRTLEPCSSFMTANTFRRVSSPNLSIFSSSTTRRTKPVPRHSSPDFSSSSHLAVPKTSLKLIANLFMSLISASNTWSTRSVSKRTWLGCAISNRSSSSISARKFTSSLMKKLLGTLPLRFYCIPEKWQSSMWLKLLEERKLVIKKFISNSSISRTFPTAICWNHSENRCKPLDLQV